MALCWVGYSEDCDITVVSGGTLAPCTVFDLGNGEGLRLPGGAEHGSDCPVGSGLFPGDTVTW